MKKEIPLTFRMYAGIRFSRPINAETDFISPEAHSMVMNGKEIIFDFEEYEGKIDEDDACLLHIISKNPDYDTFEALKDITEEFLKNVSEITEFCIFIDGKEIKATSLDYVTFVLPYQNWKNINIPDAVVKKAKIRTL